MQRKILATAIFALLVSFGSAHAQSTSPVILPGGCGTGSATGSLAYLTVDSTLKLCVNTTVTANVGATAQATLPTLSAGSGNALFESLSGGLYVNPIFGTTLVDATHGLPTNCISGCSGGTASNAGSGVATSSTNGTTNAWLYGFNGTTWDQLQVDASKFLKINCAIGCSAGSSAITTWGGATLGAATAWGSAPTGNVNGVNANVLASVLPTGASTSANQSTEITSLGTIATNSGTQATAANQATGNASLATIATNSAAPLPGQSNFTTNIGNVAITDASSNVALVDPCQSGAKVYTPVNVVTATNVIITGVASKKKYICGMFLYPGGTDNIAIYQATTGTSCATAAVGVIGGATTATGIIATAQAGFILPTTGYAHAATTVNQTDLCITTSAAVQLSGVVVTVDR